GGCGGLAGQQQRPGQAAGGGAVLAAVGLEPDHHLVVDRPGGGQDRTGQHHRQRQLRIQRQHRVGEVTGGGVEDLARRGVLGHGSRQRRETSQRRGGGGGGELVQGPDQVLAHIAGRGRRGPD